MPKLALKIGLPIVIGAFVVIVLISRGAADSVLSFEWQTSERLLLSAEDAKKADFSISVSPRGAHVAYVIKEQQSGKDQYRLRLDDRDVGVYSQVWETIFSPDGKRTAFLVSYGAGEGDRFIVDGKEQEKYEALMPGMAAFSPDGSLFGYQAVKDKNVFIVINGVPGKAYEMVWGIGQRSIAPLVFSANGKHYAYQARRDNKDFVVHDGKEHPVELALDHLPALSPDGARWAVVTSEPIGNNKLAPRVVVDGQPFGRTYHYIGNRPVFSPDGKRIAYSPTLRWDPGRIKRESVSSMARSSNRATSSSAPSYSALTASVLPTKPNEEGSSSLFSTGKSPKNTISCARPPLSSARTVAASPTESVQTLGSSSWSMV